MAFGFDDIVVAVGEVAEKVAETAEEVTTIVGDGVEESAGNAGKISTKLVENPEECVTELQKESSPLISQIEGDGIPEQTSNNTSDVTDSTQETKTEGLTDQEKQEIKEKTGWSDKIVDAIRTKEEAQIYIDAGLVEVQVNGKPALLQPKIDGKACNEPKWPDWNNKDLAEEGYPPRDKNGRPYELHHIGQNPDSPLAELTYEQHHSDGNFKILHTFDESSIDRVQFNKERKEYWSERSKSL